MALITCPDCGKEFSDQASACPNCGRPNRVAIESANAQRGSRRMLGCLIPLGIVGILMIIGAIASSREEARQTRREADQRFDDSVNILIALQRPDTIGSKGAANLDILMHRRGFRIPHEAMHSRAVDHMLTTTEDLARRERLDTRVVRASLGLLADPLTARQKQRRDQLLARVARVERQEFAGQLERRYLDQGMDVTVTTAGGAEHTTLRLKWILVSRVMAHQLSQDPELFETLRKLGFKRFEITDGYDETWYWTL